MTVPMALSHSFRRYPPCLGVSRAHFGRFGADQGLKFNLRCPKKAIFDRCSTQIFASTRFFAKRAAKARQREPTAMASVATRASLPREGKGKAPSVRAPSPSPAAFPFDEALNDLMQVRPENPPNPN